jgi:hypothetical protein
MAYIFVTERFVFKCREEGESLSESLSCVKFSVDGQFFRVISISRIGEKYYVIDDNKKEIRSNDTLLNVAKMYIKETYGEIKNFFECG